MYKQSIYYLQQSYTSFVYFYLISFGQKQCMIFYIAVSSDFFRSKTVYDLLHCC